jgi:hypothetical protein
LVPALLAEGAIDIELCDEEPEEGVLLLGGTGGAADAPTPGALQAANGEQGSEEAGSEEADGSSDGSGSEDGGDVEEADEAGGSADSDQDEEEEGQLPPDAETGAFGGSTGMIVAGTAGGGPFLHGVAVAAAAADFEFS